MLEFKKYRIYIDQLYLLGDEGEEPRASENYYIIIIILSLLAPSHVRKIIILAPNLVWKKQEWYHVKALNSGVLVSFFHYSGTVEVFKENKLSQNKQLIKSDAENHDSISTHDYYFCFRFLKTNH